MIAGTTTIEQMHAGHPDRAVRYPRESRGALAPSACGRAATPATQAVGAVACCCAGSRSSRSSSSCGVSAVGATGFVAVTSIATLSRDLPDPEALSTLAFDEPTHRLRPHRQGRAGSLRARRTPGRGLPRHPRAGARRDDDGRGPDVLGRTTATTCRRWSRRRSRRSRATGAAPRRSPSSSSAPGCCRRTSSSPAPTSTCARRRRSSSRRALTQAFPGQTGKQQIITAYLNQVFYGHDAYGIAAAAQIYFGISKLSELTPAQAALLAALPKSPSSLDPYRYAGPNKKGQLVVPQDVAADRPAQLDPRQPRELALDAPDAGRSSRRPRPSRSSCAATGR